MSVQQTQAPLKFKIVWGLGEFLRDKMARNGRVVKAEGEGRGGTKENLPIGETTSRDLTKLLSFNKGRHELNTMIGMIGVGVADKKFGWEMFANRAVNEEENTKYLHSNG